MVEVFKTDVASDQKAKELLVQLNDAFPNCEINFDLEDCDRILRIKGRSIKPTAILKTLDQSGVHAEVLS